MSSTRRTFLTHASMLATTLATSWSRSSWAAGAGHPTHVSATQQAQQLYQQLVKTVGSRAKHALKHRTAALPKSLLSLSYDHHRQIRFKPEKSLWREPGGFFEAQLFHPGFTYKQAVAIYLHDHNATKRLPYNPSLFDFPPEVDVRQLGDVGYCGLRLHAPFNRKDYADEVVVFQGASYFRSLGRNQLYGLSARCVAIDSGQPSREEFPDIVALHLITPAKDDRTVYVLAEVSSARSEGVFMFRVAPASEAQPNTVIDIDASLFLRGPIDVLGLAPLTSMFLFGEDTPGRFGDFRPEVHDSDTLVMWSGNGERLVRPLRNPRATTVSSFRLDNLKGFGLLQRDRQATSYHDFEARYQQRPSAWIEPRGDWGKGCVRLLEIATKLETDDNIGAFFVPDRVPSEPTTPLTFAYRVSFGDSPEPAMLGGRVVGFRHGMSGAGVRTTSDGSQRFVVDWMGDDLKSVADVSAHVDALGARVSDIRCEKNPHDGSWRLTFIVLPSVQNDIEIRAFLHDARTRAATLSETLAYAWQPGDGAHE